jgi:hypothetical protein
MVVLQSPLAAEPKAPLAETAETIEGFYKRKGRRTSQRISQLIDNVNKHRKITLLAASGVYPLAIFLPHFAEPMKRQTKI